MEKAVDSSCGHPRFFEGKLHELKAGSIREGRPVDIVGPELRGSVW